MSNKTSLSYSVINLKKKGSSALSTFTDRSWNSSIRSDLWNDSGFNNNNSSNSKSSLNQFSTSGNRNSSYKRKRKAVQFQNQIATRPSNNNKKENSAESTTNQENDRDEFFIENIESDDDSRGSKKFGLCVVEDGKQLIVKLNRKKRNRSSGNLDESLERLNYYNSKNNLNDSGYLNGTSLDRSKIKSNLIDSPSCFKPNNTHFPNSQSTPKVGSRVQKKLEQIETDFSPFKRKPKNQSDRRVDSPKTPLRPISQNVNKIDQPFKFRKSEDQTTPTKSISISQQISPTYSPEQSFKLKKPKIHKLANQSLRQFKSSSNQKKKKRPVVLKHDCKTLVPYDNGHINVIRNRNDNLNINNNNNDNDKDKDKINSVNSTPVKSQYISQVQSPIKGDGPTVKESRNFLLLSKKMTKLIKQHNLSKFKSMNKRNPVVEVAEPPSVLSNLLEVVYTESESRKHWLSEMKNDEIKRDSLFLKLINVKAATNGFVDCDCIIDIERMKEVFIFKYDNLKTLLPVRFANDYEVSSKAILEYLSPWYTYDCLDLKTTFIINPFWIHIIDHGVPSKNCENSDDYEVIYSNPNKDQFL